jgi:nitroreductase
MIPLRRTHGRMYRPHAIGEHDLLLLREAAEAAGGELTVVDPDRRHRLAELLLASPEPLGGQGAALDGALSGVPSLSGEASNRALLADELVRSTVLVLSTPDDTRADWVRAGMALQSLLLTATARGLVASFVDQSMQQPRLRRKVATVLNLDGAPQCLLRVGRAMEEVPATPRRPLTDLLLK